jgi:hypothetical protein
MVYEIWRYRSIKPPNFTDIPNERERIDASPPPLHGMNVKAESFDGGAIPVDMRNDMNIVTGALRGSRHRHPMRHEVPVLGHEIDQDRIPSMGV